MLTRVSDKIYKTQRKMTVCIDIIYVSGLKFFKSIKRNIKFATVKKIDDRKEETRWKAMKNVFITYKFKN